MRVLSLVALCLALYLPGLFSLPPIDRDEARFAQASRQMLASGDFIRPRFQEADRFKKPIGIYWLQAAAVAVAGVGQQPLIWAYRVPSVAGAVIAVLLTYMIGARLFDGATGCLGAALLACSLLLDVEAHQATTDAALLACVAGAQWCAAMLWQPSPSSAGSTRLEAAADPRWRAAGFWIALALGILIKGPVAPLVCGLTWLTLALAERRLPWRALQPSLGVPLLLAIVAPWALAVGLATDWSFFTEAWRGDLLPKLSGGHESHWGPPGYYLLLSPLTFWPGSLVAGLGMVHAWNRRHEPAVRFCLAWLVPAWIAFELIPTKLPHYVLPLYPALALLAARAVYSATPRWRIMQAAAVAWTALTLALAVLIAVGPVLLDGIRLAPLVGAAAAALTGIGVFRFCQRQDLRNAVRAGIAGGTLTLGLVLGWVLPGLDALWPSRQVARAIVAHDGDRPGPRSLITAGYDEPSLVFLLGAALAIGDGKAAADLLQQNTDGLAVISEPERARFAERAAALGIGVKELWNGEGMNYSKGKRVHLSVFVRRE